MAVDYKLKPYDWGFSKEKYEELRALHEGSCNVLFLSNEALSAMVYISKFLLWPTRWHGGQRGEELPQIAKDIYEELNMNTCTVEALGVAIGEALTMTINVQNQQVVDVCCAADVGSVDDDGGIVQPPLVIPPETWGGDLPAASATDICALAYACWEYGGIILDLLDRVRLVAGVLAVIAVIVATFVPPAWAVILAGTSLVGLTAVLASFQAQSTLFSEAVSAGQNWVTDKDSIICGFVTALGGTAVDVENEFVAAMLAVYGGLLDETDIGNVVLLVSGSEIGDWVQDNLFDGGDFSPLDMPVGYVCCPSPPAVWEHVHGYSNDGCILTGIYSSCFSNSEEYDTAQNGSSFAYGYPSLVTGDVAQVGVNVQSSGVGSVVLTLVIDDEPYAVVTLVDTNGRQDHTFDVPVPPSLVDAEIRLQVSEGNGGGVFSYEIYRSWVN